MLQTKVKKKIMQKKNLKHEKVSSFILFCCNCIKMNFSQPVDNLLEFYSIVNPNIFTCSLNISPLSVLVLLFSWWSLWPQRFFYVTFVPDIQKCRKKTQTLQLHWASDLENGFIGGICLHLHMLHPWGRHTEKSLHAFMAVQTQITLSFLQRFEATQTL